MFEAKPKLIVYCVSCLPKDLYKYYKPDASSGFDKKDYPPGTLYFSAEQDAKDYAWEMSQKYHTTTSTIEIILDNRIVTGKIDFTK